MELAKPVETIRAQFKESAHWDRDYYLAGTPLVHLATAEALEKERDTLQAKLNHAHGRERILQSERDAARANLASSQKEVLKLESKLELERDALRTELSTTAKDYRECIKERNELRTELDKLRDTKGRGRAADMIIAALQTDIEKIKVNWDAARNNFDRTRCGRDTLRAMIATQNKMLADLRASVAELESEAVRLRAIEAAAMTYMQHAWSNAFKKERITLSYNIGDKLAGALLVALGTHRELPLGTFERVKAVPQTENLTWEQARKVMDAGGCVEHMTHRTGRLSFMRIDGRICCLVDGVERHEMTDNSDLAWNNPHDRYRVIPRPERRKDERRKSGGRRVTVNRREDGHLGRRKAIYSCRRTVNSDRRKGGEVKP